MLTIKTDNRPRNLLSWDELTERERREFDYLTDEDSRLSADFVRYRGVVYDIGEMSYVPKGSMHLRS